MIWRMFFVAACRVSLLFPLPRLPIFSSTSIASYSQLRPFAIAHEIFSSPLFRPISTDSPSFFPRSVSSVSLQNRPVLPPVFDDLSLPLSSRFPALFSPPHSLFPVFPSSFLIHRPKRLVCWEDGLNNSTRGFSWLRFHGP